MFSLLIEWGYKLNDLLITHMNYIAYAMSAFVTHLLLKKGGR